MIPTRHYPIPPHSQVLEALSHPSLEKACSHIPETSDTKDLSHHIVGDGCVLLTPAEVIEAKARPSSHTYRLG